MQMNETAGARQHAPAGPVPPAPPEPTYAERARTLFSLASVATLCTHSKKCPGFPFGSLMPYALDAQGRPIFLMSSMAMHTQNLKNDVRCSLFVGPEGAGGDPLGAARATMLGNAEQLPKDALRQERERYLDRHPSSRSWVDFADFSFFRLQPVDFYYVGGFGVMGWVEAAEYERATPDPLAEAAPGILAHMNKDHVDAMILLARRYTGLEASEAAMTSVDRLGFWLRLKTSEGMKGSRINFPREVTSAQQTRETLVEMVGKARAESHR